MKEKYRKENLEPIIKSSKNFTEVLRYLNMTIHGNSRKTLKKYIKLHNIDISHFETTNERYLRVNGELGKIKRIPLNKILVLGSTYTTTSELKNRLYNEGFKARFCEKCGQDEIWNGEKMSLILDHINGVNNDHRIENLRIVCPNCNATLPTHCRGSKFIIKNKEKSIKRKYNIITRTIKRRKVERPSYAQLLIEVNEIGYSATGRKYGVSDNAIRKWVKFYEKNDA